VGLSFGTGNAKFDVSFPPPHNQAGEAMAWEQEQRWYPCWAGAGMEVAMTPHTPPSSLQYCKALTGN